MNNDVGAGAPPENNDDVWNRWDSDAIRSVISDEDISNPFKMYGIAPWDSRLT